ncbi:phosphoribosyl-ATP diphosphatase [Pelagibacterales bacterium SAG-MED39]|nr:phosphoribosyl-ATP diphosphatase [Pelagibacterales bacterium SAG-MED39]
MLSTLEDLILMIRDRKKTSLKNSYTKRLLDDKILSREKVEEEIKELIESVENNSNKIHEAADVFYHLAVYLEANDIKIEDVLSELNKRKE